MYKDNKISNKWILYVKAAVLLTVTTALFMAVFAAVMYFAQLDKNLSPLFATVSIAAGSLISAYYLSGKIGNKGYLTGFLTGLIVFLIVTIISLIIDDGTITANTVFHFIIIMLSSIIGGIMGVNKKGKKYI